MSHGGHETGITFFGIGSSTSEAAADTVGHVMQNATGMFVGLLLRAITAGIVDPDDLKGKHSGKRGGGGH